MTLLSGKVCVFLALALAGVAAQTSATPKPADIARQKAKQLPAENLQMPDPVPIPPMSPEELPAGAPSVSFRDGQLRVDADNATLGEVLNSIGKTIGAQIEEPATADSERVAIHFSGAPAQVIGALLDDEKYGYVILYPPQEPDHVQRVILTTQTHDPGRPALALQGKAGSSLVAPHTEPGPTPYAEPYASVDTSTSAAQAPAIQPVGSLLQENIAHAQSQMAEMAEVAEAQPSSNPPATDNSASPPSPSQNSAVQPADKSPMQVLQDLYQTRQQLQALQNQSQKSPQN
jgi:hypothetical protein